MIHLVIPSYQPVMMVYRRNWNYLDLADAYQLGSTKCGERRLDGLDSI